MTAISNNLSRQGTFAIFPGHETIEPAAVYVGNLNKMDMLCLHILNSGTIAFCNPESNTLLDLDYPLLTRLRKEWELKTIDRRRERLLKELEKA